VPIIIKKEGVETKMMRIPFDIMKAEIKRVLITAGMTEAKADICAQIHTETSRDGIFSHGLNRVAQFVEYVRKGWVDINAEPTLIKKLDSLESYEGNRGPGILNAKFAINRAMEIAKEQGVGIVTLRNTTHWMRGGTYGWEAADRGFIGICWTNTDSCMPAWGAKNVRLGNNPFIMAVPRQKGHLVIDMAISQYSYGKLRTTRLNNELLPFPGGFDKEGNLTRDPGLIEDSKRSLPIGYWKGSGFAVLLDTIAAVLAGGLATVGIDQLQEGSGGCCCQLFMAIDPYQIGGKEFVENTINQTVSYIKSSEPAMEGKEVFYPGELEAIIRRENMEIGIPVNENIWNELLKL
jgi:3-dehydro-L-gulonate 2-dehydrogenase